MTSKDLEKLIKCLLLTTSSMDGEALAAIRAANGILMKENLNWLEFIKQQVTIVNATPAQEKVAPRKKKAEVDADVANAAFDLLFSYLPDNSFRSTIESIHEQWTAEEWMSPRQWEVVEKAARRYRPRWEDAG